MSDSFEDDYPQFLQALTHYAYPGDVRRFREAHSEWRAPREHPPLYTKDVWRPEYGFDIVVGEACRALISDLEEEVVRGWWRSNKDEPYGEAIKPVRWRRMREAAPCEAALPPKRATGSVFEDPAPLNKKIGPIPERDALIFLIVHETFLADLVVSSHDLLKAGPAPRARQPTHDELVVAYKETKASGAENREQQDEFVERIYGKLPKKVREGARKDAGVAGKPGPKRQKL
jgi:hypothetical protein